MQWRLNVGTVELQQLKPSRGRNVATSFYEETLYLQCLMYDNKRTVSQISASSSPCPAFLCPSLNLDGEIRDSEDLVKAKLRKLLLFWMKPCKTYTCIRDFHD